ncbi:MAG: TolB-like protein [Woeseiaceae bacterium]|jgi:TolB-like protein
MSKLFSAFTERRIWRVLVAYPGVTFIWLQAVEFFINNYQLDSRLLTASIIAAVVLFPAAVVWNWRHGEVGEQDFSRPEIGAYTLFAIATVASVAWYWNVTPPTTRAYTDSLEPARTIAVLPFENTGNDPNVQFLCDGIAESLINWLATVPNVDVISKSASFRVRDEANNPAMLAQILDVDGVIKGRLERVGEQIVVSTSFVDTRNETQVWGERVVAPATELIALEQSIVASIKNGLRLEVSDEVLEPATFMGTENPTAYEHYLRGHFLIQSTNSESIDEGLNELREAIRLDPKFARPHADIADAMSQMISYGMDNFDEILGEARNAAYTAAALAPKMAEAHTAVGTINQYYIFDWKETDNAYEAAIAASPLSPVPFHRYADFLVFTLRTEYAREIAARALAMDPLDSSSMHAVGFSALFDGDFPAAAKALGDWNRFHPNSRWSYIKHSVALALNGQCDLALSQAKSVEQLINGTPDPLMDSWLAWSYKVCGNEDRYALAKARFEALLKKDPDIVDAGVAYYFALEGDTDALIELITRVVESNSPLRMFASVFLADNLGWATSDTMPADPRYLALLESIGFPLNQ